MSANPSIHVIDELVGRSGGLVWHRLHSEREVICETLLKEPGPTSQAQLHEPSAREVVMRTANWHRELLQARLRKIDDALDRLMSASYGICCRCGNRLEDTTLAADPAIAFCTDCWQRVQTRH